MKYLTPLLFLFLLSACHEVNEQTAIRRIINETDYRLEIIIYGDERAESFQYEIMPQDSLNIEGSCFFGASEYCSLDWTTRLAFGEIIFQDSLR
ncbi:hypothetical protein SAMN05661096_00066 [Marivirga sericea]|uniref:Uncharacterized protein n=1 Tax=Marivirga sericea TaxID=1028 RepID=A0A1X7I078_9BACT|nr:hypothetical protein [Marivirga sericea]SMG07704.1 hypothetical protein SAMN05661096_00066 [Marivirga sericea]